MTDTLTTTTGEQRLATRMARGAEFLGAEMAIMAGAMSWVSERNLVSAMSNAGGFGVIACGAMTPELLDTEIAATRAMTSRPFGVNLITMHPQLFDLIAVCGRHQIGHVVLAGGLPQGRAGGDQGDRRQGHLLRSRAQLGQEAHPLGRRCAGDRGMEAGGHIGPVSTSVLAQEMLPEIAEQVPVFVAGGIGRGEAIAGYLDMGAAGVQLGTRFVCATESIAHPNFKKAFIRASARDAVASVQIDPRLPVIPVRALKNAGGELFTAKQREVAQSLDEGKVAMAEAQLQIEHYWGGAPPRGDRGRCRAWLGDGGPVGRHGDQGRADRRHPGPVDGRSRRRAGRPRGVIRSSLKGEGTIRRMVEGACCGDAL